MLSLPNGILRRTQRFNDGDKNRRSQNIRKSEEKEKWVYSIEYRKDDGIESLVEAITFVSEMRYKRVEELEYS